MKTYVGTIVGNDDDRIIRVYQPGKEPYRLGLRLDLGNHSPTGFAWGYDGSGPTQAAIAICADLFGEPARDTVSRIAFNVRSRLLARLPMDESFCITETQVREAAQ